MTIKIFSRTIFALFLATLINTINAESPTVNYDTAWTFVYDGGRDSVSGDAYQDDFYDVKPLPNGSVICAGSSNWSCLLIKLDSSGKVVMNKTYRTNHEKGQFNSHRARSIDIAKNSDIIVGGERYAGPWVARFDSSGNIKWTAWYYDTTQGVLGRILTGPSFINSIQETSRGQIICAIGEQFPGGSPLENYAAYLEYDSSGILKRVREWDNQVGVSIAGFSIDETRDHYFLMAGKQNVFFLDSTGAAKVKRSYSFMLEGVGSVTNNVTRAKILRDGTLMVAGQAYEGTCWMYWQKLYYDAWWSPIYEGSAANVTWDTAGFFGADDYLYDFTQLAGGRIAFVGKNAMGDGVWTFVTDSTGKEILWEKQTLIPYGSTDGRNARPYSVCATPDSGFTLVGPYGCLKADGEMNAFAAHFIPVPPTITVALPQTSNIPKVYCKLTGSKAMFTFSHHNMNPKELSIFNASGKLINHFTTAIPIGNSKQVIWSYSKSARGIYFYKIKANDEIFTGRITIGM